jgi:hypothetical protein
MSMETTMQPRNKVAVGGCKSWRRITTSTKITKISTGKQRQEKNKEEDINTNVTSEGNFKPAKSAR